MQVNNVINYIVFWLKNYIKNSKSNGFVVGISGGIDSSVTSFLVAKTNYPTLLLEIPLLKDNDLPRKHAKFMLKRFSNVSYIRKNLCDFFNFFCKTFDIYNNKINNNLALANAQSRIRMLILYYYANLNNYLVVGTGNKVEDFGIGFFTKYGDGGVDLQPIADLNKSDIQIIAKKLKILYEIRNSIPTDGLWKDERTDKEQIGLSYDDLELAMKIKDKKLKYFSKKEYSIIKKYQYLHNKNKHKIIPIPICHIPNYMK
ncbi:NAD(+) synthase [Blattabacterium cuenoti]|uniref:NAD(+) synthase n=1 Tax=Blattabacterium cuenoti TaxID=1653831 RepID=UPI00163CE695|nr:NAD(+) synthase [Blattabacterium cuenoti]